MHEETRIKRICGKLEKLWETMPTLRFFQLIDYIEKEHLTSDSFHSPDNITELTIERMLKMRCPPNE